MYNKFIKTNSTEHDNTQNCTLCLLYKQLFSYDMPYMNSYKEIVSMEHKIVLLYKLLNDLRPTWVDLLYAPNNTSTFTLDARRLSKKIISNLSSWEIHEYAARQGRNFTYFILHNLIIVKRGIELILIY